MDKIRFALSLLALVLTACFALSCGGSQFHAQPASITVSPATVTAQQAQFTATGYYQDPPRTITPLSVSWAACQQNAATTEVTVAANGMAQCNAGASGTYSINAFVAGNCNLSNACGTACTIYGTAQLTCP
ncbi:MAG: hypothetical protein WAK29_05755 [Terriglobales bacterium]